jgi:hypothetical protein
LKKPYLSQTLITKPQKNIQNPQISTTKTLQIYPQKNGQYKKNKNDPLLLTKKPITKTTKDNQNR